MRILNESWETPRVESLRLLLIDDNPDDRSLVVRELRRDFPVLEVRHVTDQRTFDEALVTWNYDLIITDYQLRWTNGLNVLKALKKRSPDCPVIMFTGTGSEEIAVEAMKNGLDDYVLKTPSHFARLPASAHMALKAARDRVDLKLAQQEKENLILELQDAIARVKTLTGLLPICACCKKIRDNGGYWNQLELYIQQHSDAAFTHSFCPECAHKLYPELFEDKASVPA